MNGNTDVAGLPFPYADATREDVFQYLPAGIRRVLDVGCGLGGFGALIKERLGAEVWGVEPHAEAARWASARLDVIKTGPFSDANGLPSSYFDAVTFCDSLEHMEDPWQALRLARSLLRPGGHVVVSVPNIRHICVLGSLLLAGRWCYSDSGILDRTHLRFFTRSSLLTTLREAGLQPVRIHGMHRIGRRWMPLTCVLRLLGLGDTTWLQFVAVARAPEAAT